MAHAVVPDVEGISVLISRVRESVPLCLQEVNLTKPIREEATKLGAYAIVGKPYDLGELRTLVNQLSARIPMQSHEPSLLPK